MINNLKKTFNTVGAVVNFIRYAGLVHNLNKLDKNIAKKEAKGKNPTVSKFIRKKFQKRLDAVIKRYDMEQFVRIASFPS